MKYFKHTHAHTWTKRIKGNFPSQAPNFHCILHTRCHQIQFGLHVFILKKFSSITLPLYSEINILVHLQIPCFNLFLVQRQSSNVTPACRTLIFEALKGELWLTCCRDLREGINFQVWFQSSVQHFQVCFVLSELLRRRLKLQSLKRAPVSENRRSEEVAAVSQMNMLNVSSETVEVLPLESLGAHPKFGAISFICWKTDRRQTCNSWFCLETTSGEMFSDLERRTDASSSSLSVASKR